MTKVKTYVMYKQVSKVMPGSEVSQKSYSRCVRGPGPGLHHPWLSGEPGQAISLRHLMPESY